MAEHGRTWQKIAENVRELQIMAENGREWQNMADKFYPVKKLVLHYKAVVKFFD
jgi:hypothetical protein